MGAVLGIAAYGRTKEKLGGAENGGLSEGFGPGAGTTYVPPTGSTVNVSNQPPASFAAPAATPPASGFGTGFNQGLGDTPAASAPVVDPDRPLRRQKT